MHGRVSLVDRGIGTPDLTEIGRIRADEVLVEIQAETQRLLLVWYSLRAMLPVAEPNEAKAPRTQKLVDMVWMISTVCAFAKRGGSSLSKLGFARRSYEVEHAALQHNVIFGSPCSATAKRLASHPSDGDVPSTVSGHLHRCSCILFVTACQTLA